jgi:hypothetical protein
VIISGKREAAWQCVFIHCGDVSGGMCVEGWTRNVCGQEHAWDTAMVHGSTFQCASLCSGNNFPSMYWHFFPCHRLTNNKLHLECLNTQTSKCSIYYFAFWPPRGLVVSFWLLIMRSRVQFLVLPWGFFLEGEDSHGDHGLGSLVEL